MCEYTENKFRKGMLNTIKVDFYALPNIIQGFFDLVKIVKVLKFCTYHRYINEFFLQALSADDSPHIVFGPACYHHGMLASSTFWNQVTVNGENVTAQSQLLAWLDSVILDGVSTCDGVNCEKGCPPVDTSDEATACIEK